MAYVYTTTPTTSPLYQLIRVVWYLLDILEAILLIRFVLRLLGANPGAGFTQIMYAISHPFVAPFQNVFGQTSVAGATFEWTTLLAMIVYWLIALAIVRLLAMTFPPATRVVDDRVTRYDLTDEDMRNL